MCGDMPTFQSHHNHTQILGYHGSIANERGEGKTNLNSTAINFISRAGLFLIPERDLTLLLLVVFSMKSIFVYGVKPRVSYLDCERSNYYRVPQ